MLVALLLAFAVFGAACASQEPTDTTQQDDAGEPQQGGTMTFIAEQFPPHMQCDKADNNLAWCSHPMRAILLGAYEVKPDFSYGLDLLAEEAVLEEGPPMKVTYKLIDEAQWSDGTPITAADFEYTWQMITDKKVEFISRAGYEKIESIEIADDKNFTFTFSEPYVPFKELFDTVYPAHVLEGEDWNTVWKNCICDPATGEPIGSGPFLLTEFRKNQQLTLEANENWWGEEGPYLDRIVMPYVPETQTEIQQLRGGEADMIYPSPQPELRALQGLAGIVNAVGAGPSWQHLDFNYARPPLDQLFVRQAIAHGIDRQGIVDQLIKPLFPEAGVLQQAIYMENQAEYEPHFDIYDFDPVKATTLLEDNGCTKGADGIYECDGEKLSFDYLSTAGNKLRELMFQIIQANLKAVGIEVKNDFAEDPFGPTGLSGSQYDIIQFAWVGSPDPEGNIEIFKCEGSQNYQSYCNEEVTEALEATNALFDPAERAASFNEADSLMAEDLPILPLWQYPQAMAFHDNFHGLENNTTQWGPLWNAEMIWMEQE